jgi:hypothetical protein
LLAGATPAAVVAAVAGTEALVPPTIAAAIATPRTAFRIRSDRVRLDPIAFATRGSFAILIPPIVGKEKEACNKSCAILLSPFCLSSHFSRNLS